MSLVRFSFFLLLVSDSDMFLLLWWIVITVYALPFLGYGGGFNERENVEYIEREESDGEYDEVSYTLVCRLKAA